MTANELTGSLRKLGLTQHQLAELIGVGRRTMGRWCAEGNVPAPAAILIRLIVEEDLDPARVAFYRERR